MKKYFLAIFFSLLAAQTLPIQAEANTRTALAAAKIQLEQLEKLKECNALEKAAKALPDGDAVKDREAFLKKYADTQANKAILAIFDLIALEGAKEALKEKAKAKLDECKKTADKAKPLIKALVGSETVGASILELRKELSDLEPACKKKKCATGIPLIGNIIRSEIEAVALDARKKHEAAIDFSEEWAKVDPNGDATRISDIYWLDYQDKSGALSETVVWGRDMPEGLRCSKADVRIWHFCVEPRFFDPSARVFFEKGSSDSLDEADIYDNGSLSGSIELVGAYLPFRFGHGRFSDKWSWGPVMSIGIARGEDDDDDAESETNPDMEEMMPPELVVAPGDDSDAEASNDSDAPSVIATFGLMLEYRTTENIRFGVEGGWAWGWSADEMFDDRSDKARYVGLRLDIPLPGKD